ncbi:hypothetical protein [Oricola sp.]|uniref:hypothetical protein n=1 Tax=Oricola sp. TaxID=1979950 RepID=UPI0025FF4B67|nr:hypothetical protein [Oricola sp.]MCI5075639.1 hypothetical protein [Oricola sp.]
MKTLTLTEDQKQTLLACVEHASPDRPLGMAEVRKSLRVMNALSGHAPEIDIEDADFDYLATRFGQTKWLRASADIVAIADLLDEAGKAT